MGGFYVTHLESAPETGRRRFMAVSKNQEELIRQQALQETVQQFQGKILPLHHPLTQEVRRITRRIITASNLGYLHGDLEHTIGDPFADSWGGDSAAEIPRTPSMNADREWVVLVVDDMKFVNAFAAPGLVCVSTGIMPVARDEEGLAAVIGHEIGHVAMRHSAEHLSQYKLLLPVIGILLLLGLDLGLSSFLTNILHSLPHSRALETEADIVGLKLMSRACYNPAAAPRFFQDLSKFEKSDVPTFLRTHPPTSARIAHLKTLLPESSNIYNSNPECSRLEEMRAQGILGKARYHLA
ncbi:peptidase family M48-domain-containing protein [Mycena polygramma]|nr:peptidase family M48-domain-containing protein [Mycena polygramma]